ncbi:hypothetical protein [Microbacterium thalassium]|uniref:Putative membrane protein n=1 Tax=Microbacterium thalassium TaxID=362649 RepID=A0A7X0FPI0_9MICO|nr:hypothetical protein [Microbacterium thalassium]MBB6391298.1 putative membrane protein [Microbacterium thalassium]GLK23590.1 hypothetical protein GCM10017607_09080 [Microbacterium thalassium]
MHAISSISATAPRTPWDENGILQMARIILGEQVSTMSLSGYYPGTSFLIAPIWLLTQDPATVYRASNILLNIVALSAIIPLALIARRIGLTTAKAVTVAAITMMLPSRIGVADYVLSEQLLTTLVIWATFAAFAVWKNPTLLNGALFSLAVVGAYLAHARALVFVAVAGVWLVLFVRRRWQVSLVGLGVLVLGAIAVRAVSRAINAQLIPGGFRQEAGFLGKLTSAPADDLLRIALNQTWVQLVGTSGLIAIGAVVLTVWVVRDLRSWQVGPAGFVVGTAFGAVMMSVIAWGGSKFLETTPYRFDVWVYSRYIDPFVVVVVLIALVAIVRGVSISVVAVAAGGSVAVILPVLFWVAPWVPTWGLTDGPANVAAIEQWRRFWPAGPFDWPLVPTLTNQNSFWLLASLWVLGVLTAIALLRRRPRIFTTVALAVSIVVALAANPEQYRDYPDGLTAALESVEDGGELLPVDFYFERCDSSLAVHQARNWVGYWFAPREVTVVRGDEPFDSDLVVACGDFSAERGVDALVVEGDPDYNSFRLWVLPGELQDQLLERGLLEEPDAS